MWHRQLQRTSPQLLLHSERGCSSTSQSKRALPETEDKGLLSKDEMVKAKKICAPNEGEPEVTGESAIQNKSYTTIMTNPGTIALRTIPVYLKNVKERIKVNALLNDASTKTYVNSDVAAKLGLQGQLQRVNVSVLNGHIEISH